MITPLDVLSLETWILIGTILLLARFYLHRKWQFLAKYNIPHYPPSIMKFGTFKYTFGDNPRKFFTKDLELKEKFGMVYGTYIGTTPRIIISDPDILKQIMIKNFNNFYDRQKSFLKVSGKAMNNGLSNIGGETWRRVRHTMSPIFSTAKLRGMFSVTEKCADIMVENLKNIAIENDGKLDTKSVFSKYTLDALCSAGYGVKVDTQTKEDAKPIKMARKLFSKGNIPISLLFFLVQMFPPVENLLERFDISIFPRQPLNYFTRLTEAILKSRTSKASKQDQNMLDIMAESLITDEEVKLQQKGMTKKEITGNSMLLLLAGYDTTSSALTFLLYNLAWHKDVQQKLREEVQGMFESDKPLTYEKINEMKYITQCVNESLRLYSPFPRNARFCEEEITINGLTIPKGINVIIPSYGMARDPEYWDQPLEFKPERMEDMSKIDPIIFQPFGAGPRSCIGIKFAYLQMKIAICKLLLIFEFDVSPETPKPPLETIVKTTVRPKVDILYLKATLMKQ